MQTYQGHIRASYELPGFTFQVIDTKGDGEEDGINPLVTFENKTWEQVKEAATKMAKNGWDIVGFELYVGKVNDMDDQWARIACMADGTWMSDDGEGDELYQTAEKIVEELNQEQPFKK